MVNVGRCFVITPSGPTPTAPMCVSELDQEKPITHALIVYFFRPFTASFSFASASQQLRDSLSQVLVRFYPLAGRLHYITGSGGRVALECNAKGAVFYEASSSAKIDDLKDFALPTERRSLVPVVDYGATDLDEVPLLMVQLTEMSCGGIVLGIGVSNIMVDGTCASHFMDEWARTTRNDPSENHPFLDRSVLLVADPTPPPPRFKHDRFEPNSLLIGQSNDHQERNKETKILTLHLTKDQVQKLKDNANKTRPSNISRPFSRFEAIAGHIWRSASKARGHQPMQPTKLYIPVSIRTQMSLPKWYFGNAIIKQVASTHSGELLTRPLSYTCGKIREAVEIVTEDYIISALDDIKRQADLTPFRTSHTVGATTGCFDGNPNMEIISWLGISFDGLDFGWGKSSYMGPAAVTIDGKGIVSSREGGDGSVSVALRFQTAYVDSYKNYFYQIG